MSILIYFGFVVLFIGLLIFFLGWISNISQVKSNQTFLDQHNFGFASFEKFKENFDNINWSYDKNWEWSLFYYDENSFAECNSKIHADIFMFNHIGMIMKTPIDYWRAIIYVHKYIKEHFKYDMKKEKLYQWD